MKTEQKKMAYYVPFTEVLMREVEQCIAASETGSMGGIDPFENNDLIDELTGII